MNKVSIVAMGIVLIVAALTAGFYYALQPLKVPQSITQIQQAPSPVKTPTNAVSTVTPNSQNTDANEINAQFLAPINTGYSFHLANYPNMQFKIVKVVKASGGMPVGSPGTTCYYDKDNQYISYKVLQYPTLTCFFPDLHLNSPEGFHNSPDALVVVTLAIDNNSAETLNGRVLLLTYQAITSSTPETRLSTEYAGAQAYAKPFSSATFNFGFSIPSNQNEVVIDYGDYGPQNNGVYGGENLFSKTESGLMVDFNKGTFSEIPG